MGRYYSKKFSGRTSGQKKIESEHFYFKHQMYEIEYEIREKNKVREIKVGPRIQFLHYINDLNMKLEEAIPKILKEFPSLDENIIKSWYIEEQNKKNQKDKTVSDEDER